MAFVKERIYESMFIIAPDVPDERKKEIVDKVVKVITERVGGKLEESMGDNGVEIWGTRKFAYKIKNYTEGYYVIVYFRCDGQKLGELEHTYRVTPEIIRWQTFRRFDLEKKERKSKKEVEEEILEEKVE